MRVPVLPGHEDCAHSVEVIRTFQGPGWEIIHCEHEHDEEVRAYDVLGNGPVVADYCQCCDRMKRRPEYI